MAFQPGVGQQPVVNGENASAIPKLKANLIKPKSRSVLGEIGNKLIPKNDKKEIPKHVEKAFKTACAKIPDPETSKEQSSSTSESCKVQDFDGKRCLLPVGVEDIDKDDFDNLFLESTYVIDIYKYLRVLEEKYKVPPKFLNHHTITCSMRATLVDWFFDVQVQFHLIQETMQMAVSLLDRYLHLSGSKDVTKDNLQLVGLGVLLIASKYEETYPPEIEDFKFMANSAFSKTEIKRMECKILRTLDFNLGKPVPIRFLRRFSKAIKADPEVHSLAKFFLDISLLDFKLSSQRPSKVAAASLYLAQRVYYENQRGDDKIWNQTVVYYSTYTCGDIKPLIPRLAANVKNSTCDPRLKAVKNKYSSSKFHRVGLSPLLSIDSFILEEIVETIEPFNYP